MQAAGAAHELKLVNRPVSCSRNELHSQELFVGQQALPTSCSGILVLLIRTQTITQTAVAPATEVHFMTSCRQAVVPFAFICTKPPACCN